METSEKTSFSDFNLAFDEFISENSGTTMPPTVNHINSFINDCPFNKLKERFIQITFPECPLEIFLYQINAGPNYLHGSWIVVSNGVEVIAFHFPLNQGLNVILNAYFNGDSDLLNYVNFSGARQAAESATCIQNYFINPFRVNLFWEPPVNHKNYSLALQIVWECSYDIFCKGLKTK